MAPTVYVVDSDPEERKWIESVLAPAAASVVFLDDRAALLAHMPLPGEACLIAFADRDGAVALDLVRELRRGGSKLPVIVFGPLSAFRTAVDIARLEATDFLERPVSERELQRAVRRACGAGR
jgi:two-component system, LuxR family, response regulator FixJ